MTTTPTSGAADLRTAAQAVVDRWDTPLWKDVPATAEYIGRLRAALAAGQATAAQQGAAYAALPAHSHAGRVYEEGFLVGTCPLYTADKMRAFADATHALRASHGQAPADSVQEDAALWHWLAEYLVGTRTDLDDEIVASETVNDLRKLVESAIKQGAKQ